MLSLVSLGLCALVVWIIRRAVRPAKVSLRGTPGRINTVNPAHVLVLLLVWQASREAGAWVLGRWLPGEPEHLGILLAGIQQTVWLATSLAVAAVAFRHGLRQGMGLSLRHWVYDTGRGVFAYLAVLPICFGLFAASKALYWAVHHQPPGEHQMLVVMHQVSWPWQVMAIASAVVLAPLSEEVFCRGLVQSMFRRYTARPWAAVGVTSAIFALLHWDSVTGGSGAGWVQLPALFALGVVLGYNYERSGRLVAPIIIHVLFNGVSVGMSLAGG
ncbi:MAG: CPBP family intramembrane metalloprotease [Phycisphaerae bacterium]|nr:CPBP family intramembrane metalloprotease [Phycisphaerae bacterium]